MTQIELETYNAVKSAARKYLSLNERVDWEERRFLIAKDVLSSIIAQQENKFAYHYDSGACVPDERFTARLATAYADALITELKGESHDIKPEEVRLYMKEG